MKKFTMWLEQRQEAAVRDAVVSKIRSDVGGDDDDTILQMKTAELDQGLKQELMKLAPVMDIVKDDTREQIMDAMGQPDATVGSIINQIVGEANPRPGNVSMPPEGASDGVPTENPGSSADMPQPHQGTPTGV